MVRPVSDRFRGLLRPWNSPVQRMRREVVRDLGNIRSRDHWPSAPSASLYWWDWRSNFGDGLSPWLLQQAGINVSSAGTGSATVTAIGSVLEHLPDHYAGFVWGAGLVEEVPKRFDHAHVYAVRGHLTMRCLGLDGTALGDPGLLVSDYLEPRTGVQEGGVTLVRHFLHARDPLPAWLHDTSRHVDVSGSPDVVLGQLSTASSILTSSLHGLVVADSLGIPAAWYREARDSLVTPFKFRDYESVVTPGWSRRIDIDSMASASSDDQFHRADTDAVSAAKADLRSSLGEMKTRLPWRNPVTFAIRRSR